MRIALLALLPLACGAPGTPSAAQVQALDTTNGDNLNGDNLNGDNLNGTGLGVHLVSASYASVEIDDLLDSVSISGSELVGSGPAGSYGGADFDGASMRGVSDTGAMVKLRIVDASSADEVWNYQVQYRDSLHHTWWPLCRDGLGNAVPALAVDGWWNYATGAKTVDGASFTFACKDLGAIGKCASHIGYQPWVSGRHHQACVRLLRADFCGDGTAYTQNGNRVDIYDGIGIQTDTEPLWFFEAEWDENGARCFSPLNCSRQLVPCYVARLDLTCGSASHFSSGALLMDKTPTAGLTP